MKALRAERLAVGGRIKGRDTFELARLAVGGRIKGKNTFELARLAVGGRIKGKNTFELARLAHRLATEIKDANPSIHRTDFLDQLLV
ncbi:hypothetical protein AMQ83_18000 [Paenibacillus riograndensis]|nr:hypothetical protein AMQ83_18000 [Paenibacillus riograndensis]